MRPVTNTPTTAAVRATNATARPRVALLIATLLSLTLGQVPDAAAAPSATSRCPATARLDGNRLQVNEIITWVKRLDANCPNTRTTVVGHSYGASRAGAVAEHFGPRYQGRTKFVLNADPRNGSRSLPVNTVINCNILDPVCSPRASFLTYFPWHMPDRYPAAYDNNPVGVNMIDQSGRVSNTPPPQRSSATGPAGELIVQVVELTNRLRAARNCKPLQLHRALVASAQAHASDMAGNGYLNHTSRDGRTPSQRMRAAGAPDGRRVAENIAAGQRTPTEVVAAWAKSAGHLANIVNCDLAWIGIGVASNGGRTYWVQNFSG